ncbi:hypothetical protein F383_14301 [Gossypium arboreum]|uniref:Uncharacterized protein n=1 Tax=Gossypium arboreum TaxID=29729 RepID=A0A0B0NC54_GOSAR|nr:hypothetical protein F383_14301 [Gossypium arboreum]
MPVYSDAGRTYRTSTQITLHNTLVTCHLYPNLFLRFDWDFSIVKMLSNVSIESVTQFIQN